MMNIGMWIGLGILFAGFLLSLRIIYRENEWGFQPAAAIALLLFGFFVFIISVIVHI